MVYTPQGRRPGRPPAIDRIVREVEGEPWTVADIIIDSVRRGQYIEEAAAEAGLSKRTVFEWLHDGADIEQKLAAGKRRVAFTPRQLRLADFAEAVAIARHEANARDENDVERLARGVRRQVVTEKRVPRIGADGKPEKDQHGNTVYDVAERTVKVEDAVPNLAALLWRLEHRDPDRYRRRNRIELVGADGGPVELEMTVEEKRARMAERLNVIAGRLVDDPDHELADIEAQGLPPALEA